MPQRLSAAAAATVGTGGTTTDRTTAIAATEADMTLVHPYDSKLGQATETRRLFVGWTSNKLPAHHWVLSTFKRSGNVVH